MSAIALLALGTLQGCYERVVSARGLGADNYDISDPYQENSKVDDWLFGERPESKKNRSILER